MLTECVRETAALLRRAGRLIAGGLPVLLLLEGVYRLFLQALSFLANRALTWAAAQGGVGFVTARGAALPLSGLWTAAVCAVSALIFTFCSLWEISALILCLEDVRRGRRCRAAPLAFKAFRSAAQAYRFRNVLLLPVLLLLAPGLVALGRGAALLSGLGKEAPLLGALILASATAAYAIAFRWALSLHEIVLQGCALRAAGRRSARMLKGRQLPGASAVLAGVIALLAALRLGAILGSLCLGLLAKGIAPPQRALSLFWASYTRLSVAGRALSGALCSIFVLSLLCALRDACRGRPTPALVPRTGRERECARGYYAIAAALFLLAAVPGLPALDPGRPVQIVAHRAGGAIGPENTLAALDEAIRSRAVMAEIDVRLTHDGELVVLHDANLRRVAGVNHAIHSLTLAQARGYDVGRMFSAEFAGERIPTLGEMLTRARGKMEMMIEIKTGEPEAVLQAVRDLGMEEQCVLAATNYGLLETVRQLAPEVRTCYIVSSFYGDVRRMDAADQLSIRADAATLSLVRQVHRSGKEIFCWTVNDEATMRRLLAYGVDGLITDDPYLAAHVAETSGRGLLAQTIDVLGEGERLSD